MIKLVIFNINGILTGGKPNISEKELEIRQFDFRDVDAFFALKKGKFKTAFITRENTQITNWFNNRFKPEYFINGCKQKGDAVKKIRSLAKVEKYEVCYIGVSDHDILGMEEAGLSICPLNAVEDVKEHADIVLKSEDGNGVILELSDILENLNSPVCDFDKMIQANLSEHLTVFKKLIRDKEFQSLVNKTANAIIKTYNEKGKVLLCGNGGSAADSQHIAAEFVGRFKFDRPALNSEALSMNTSNITAIGNDSDYVNIFSRQIEAKGQKGDVLIGISTSGRSKNIIMALNAGKSTGMVTVGLTGARPNTQFCKACNIVIKVPSVDTARVQEAHIFIGHNICQFVEEKLFSPYKNKDI